MAYINQPAITLADNANADAFQRLRVSSPQTIFDSKQLYGDNPLVWSTYIVGPGTSSFLANNSSMILSASATSSVVRQSKKYGNYQPGKSQLIICTGNFNQTPTAGVIKKIGYYNSTSGIGFMVSGSSFGTFITTNISGAPVTTFTSQSAWNLDHYDGTGTSGKTLNITSSQIYFMDLEWLGVGRVRYGIFQGGNPTYIHQITNINALSTVYMSSPNKPIRYEVINSGSATPQTLTHICSTIASEGGFQNIGAVKALSNVNAIGINANVTCGLIALRLKSSSLDATVTPLSINSAQTAAASIYEIFLAVNPSGSLNWSWQDLPNSVVQYATASNSSLAIANTGTKIFSAINAGLTSTNNINFDPTFALGSDVTGSQDVLVVGWDTIATNAQNAAVALIWQES